MFGLYRNYCEVLFFAGPALESCQTSDTQPVEYMQQQLLMELGNSLTAIDWLPRLRGPTGKMEAPGEPPRMRPPARKPPPSPIDLTARLDPMEAQAYRYHDAKPPFSYAALITFAINSTQKKRMTLSDIYNWISSNFPYYKDAGTGWKVSRTVVISVKGKELVSYVTAGYLAVLYFLLSGGLVALK